MCVQPNCTDASHKPILSSIIRQFQGRIVFLSKENDMLMAPVSSFDVPFHKTIKLETVLCFLLFIAHVKHYSLQQSCGQMRGR